MSFNKAYEYCDGLSKYEHSIVRIIFTIVAMWCFKFLIHNQSILYWAETFFNYFTDILLEKALCVGNCLSIEDSDSGIRYHEWSSHMLVKT